MIWSSGQRAANAPEPRAIAPKAHFNGKQLAARIAKRGGEFNGDGPLALFPACIGPRELNTKAAAYQRSFVTSTGVRLEGRGVVPDELVEVTAGALAAGRDARSAALAWLDRAQR